MNKSQRFQILVESGKTVFSCADLSSLWQMEVGYTRIMASRMEKAGLLYRLSHGFYAFGKNYSREELANRLVTPSYLSFNSALFRAGVCFQQSAVFSSVGLVNTVKESDGETFKYYSMKPSLFFKTQGIDYKGPVSIATPERAILDCFYFGLLPAIDNPEKLNSLTFKTLLLLYPKTVQKKAESFISKYHL